MGHRTRTPKTEGSDRLIALETGTGTVLCEHRLIQRRERFAAGPAWTAKDPLGSVSIRPRARFRGWFEDLAMEPRQRGWSHGGSHDVGCEQLRLSFQTTYSLVIGGVKGGAPGRIRTCDTRFRRA